MSIYTINSETAVDSLADDDEFVIYDNSGSDTNKVTLTQLRAYLNEVVNVTATVLTVTAASHNNRTVTLDNASGVTVTLPAASGTGDRYTFVVKTTTTENGYIIKVANTADAMTGIAWVKATASDNAEAFATSATSDTITMDGVEQGGTKGDKWEIIDAASNVWSVHGYITATTSEVTPFSAGV